jgi:hypothetical protein
MKLFYIDESGDTAPLENGGTKIFTLAGTIIDDSDYQNIEEPLRQIKQKYFNNPDIEIKSNFLRYANPLIKIDSPLKLNLKEKYDDLEAEVTKLLIDIPVQVIATAINKTDYWQNSPSGNVYAHAYEKLLLQFQKYLAKENERGLCVIDPRENMGEKHYFGNEINDLHERLRHIKNNVPNIIEKLLFSESHQTIGIQLADLYGYPLFHIQEYRKNPSEYWRYNETTARKLLK